MELTPHKKIMHLAWVIAIGFFGSNLFYVITFFFIPQVGPNGEVIVPPVSMTLGEMQTAFYILGCVALGVKLSEEKKTMPAIGFTMMSIAQGVIFVTYTISASSHEGLEEIYRLFMSSMFLLIPSMLLIAYYSDFPKWLNRLGIIACLPLLTENIWFAITSKFSPVLMVLDGTGQFLFALTAFFWGRNTLKNAAREVGIIKTENK